MSTINTGKRRSLTIDVVRYEDSVIINTTTYDGLLAFNSYPTITLNDLALMTDNQYLQRLNDFTLYVGTLEPNVDFLSNLNDPYGNSISCNPIISYQGSFGNFNCEIDATSPTFDYTFEIIGVSSTNQGYNSTTYDDLILKTGLFSNTPAQEKYIYSIGFKVLTTIGNTATPPEFDIVFTGLDGVRYDYSLFNLRVDAGNTHIVEKTGFNLYGNNGIFIKQISNVVTFKPEVDSSVFMSGSSITKTYAIRFAPYILGNLLVDKNIRVSITPRNSYGNYFYEFTTDNFVDLGFKYTNNVLYTDITPIILQSTDTLSITNNGTANSVKIFDSNNVLKATIPITPNSNLIQIPLSGYSLTAGNYVVKLYNPNNTIYKTKNIIVYSICNFPPIGSNYGGGIVSYIHPDNSFALIIGSEDIGGEQRFCFNEYDVNPFVPISGISYDNTLGNGGTYTDLIIAALDSEGQSGYAAKLARSYNGGGYSDWYLPSAEELDTAISNLKSLGNFIVCTSYRNSYWSSSSGNWDEYHNEKNIYGIGYIENNTHGTTWQPRQPDYSFTNYLGFHDENLYSYVRPMRKTICISPTTTTTTTVANKIVKFGYLYNGFVYQDPRILTSSNDWKISGSLYYPEDDISVLKSFTSGDTNGLKDINSLYWNNLYSGTTNEYGFNARGSGYRFVGSGNIDADNTFFALGDMFVLGEADGYWGGQTFFNDHDNIFGHGSGYDDDIGVAIRLSKSGTTLTHGQSGTYVGNDGTIYPTICIGTIEWLACNLAETEYRNHDIIPNAVTNTVWYGYGQTSTGVLCAYNNDINNVFI